MTIHVDPTRRGFLAGAGSLVLAFSLTGEEVAAQAAAPVLVGDLKQYPKIGSWLAINADKTVTLMVGKVELGQGILTALVQLCAEELDIDIGRVRVVSGDTRRVPNEGVTAGSFSMPNCGMAVRQVSAEARHLLVQMAAKRLGMDAAGLTVADGVVSGGGKSVAYWDLVSGGELDVAATGAAPLKPAGAGRRYVGKSITRLDIPPKAYGEAIFVHDFRPAGMWHGRIARPPAYEAKLVSLDTSAVEAMPGVVKVVRDGRFLGVVAQREEQAIAAAQALARAAKWELPTGGPTHETIFDWLTAQKPAPKVILDKKREGGAAGASVVEATWKRPYQMHASLGTSCAVATLEADGTMRVATHSQSVFETGVAIAKMLGVPEAKVHMVHMQGSGCYGHNGADDVAADAALLARAVPGRPVRVQWSREDEHRWEPYGSAMVIKTRAQLDQKGDILDWSLDLWSTAHGTRPSGEAGNLLAARHLEKPFAMPVPANGGPPNYAADRNAIALYEFPGQKVTTHFITEMPVRVSSTRGLGAYANVIAIECFIDDLARKAGADPVEYRLRYLKNERARAVLIKAAEVFGWSKWERQEGRGRGIAFAQYKNLAAYCAIALEVAVDKASGEIKVVRAVAANDSGEMVSPDGIANQIEGGLIHALSWSLKEAVRFDASGVVKSMDWEAYPILTFAEVPKIEVALIDRPGAPFLGTGEASQGPGGAALGNAVLDAIGVRLHEVPYTPERVKAALKA